MVKLKICGITNSCDAEFAAKAGCDALGFVFYRKSPRYVREKTAALIVRGLPKKIIKVGVFVNPREETVRRIAKICRLDILQFHGRETPEFCRRFKGYRVVKAFRVKGKPDPAGILRYKTYGYLFDAFSSGKYGGSGKSFDWGLLKGFKTGRPVFLSGGISASNVREAVEKVSPEWIDVSSSLESCPGTKSHIKIRRFMRAFSQAR